MELNFLAIGVATILSFATGALWYSPVLFMYSWCREAGVDPQQTISNPGRVYSTTFILTLISVLAFTVLLGPSPDLDKAVLAALLAGFGLTATSMGINYQFAGRSQKLWLIDAGFHISRFVVIALVLAWF